MIRANAIRLLSIFALVTSLHAIADDTLTDNISPQSLNKALNEFASQSGLQIVYKTDLVAGMESKGTRSPGTKGEALDQLLAGTGLEYRFINDRTVAIEPAVADAGGDGPKKLQAALDQKITTAQTQTSPAQTASSDRQKSDSRYANSIEEIIVTAQKRSEPLQSVPMTVTAFSEEKILDFRINGLADVVSLTPSLGVADFGPASPNLTLRGIGSTDRDAGSDRSVVVFVDEVYMGRAGGSAFDLFDLERIEVLHGPQGTLFGKNVVGGAIHYITKKPAPETDAYFRVGVGNYNLRETRGMFNTPLAENVNSRFSFSTRDRDGFQTNLRTGNDVDTADNVSVRGQIQFTPSDNLTVLLSADASRDRIYGISRKVAPASGFTAFLGFFPDPNPRNVQTNVDGFFDRDIFGYSGRVDWDTSIGTFTSLTAYRNVKFKHSQDVVGIPLDSSFDANGVPRGFLSVDNTKEDYNMFSQEMRLSSLPSDDKWTWVVGAFFSREDTSRLSIRDRSLLGRTSKPSFDQSNVTKSSAIFGQLTYAVTDRLNLTLGGRYTNDKKDFGLNVKDASGGTADTLNPAKEEFSIVADDSWSEFTPKFVIDYSFTPSALVYASVSKGYKSGGFQGFAPSAAAAVVPFDPETAWSYEIGAKTQWFHDSLQVNLTGFRTDFKDLQFRQRILSVPGDQSSALVIILNAADAVINGAEASIQWLPVEGLTLGANYAYLDTELKKFLNGIPGIAPGFKDLTGNKLPLSPTSAYTLSANYRFSAGDAGTFSIGANYRYKGSHFFELTNPPEGQEPGYGILDGRITYQPTAGSFEIALWVQNATDTLYRSQVQVGARTGISRYGPPKTFGLTLSWRYQ